LMLGCTNIKLSKFLLFNMVNSALWSILVSVTGYVFGKVVYVFVNDIKKYEGYIVPAVLIGVTVLIIIYRHIVKEKEKSYGD